MNTQKDRDSIKAVLFGRTYLLIKIKYCLEFRDLPVFLLVIQPHIALSYCNILANAFFCLWSSKIKY